MLILTRRCAESLIIGDGEITVTVLGVKGNQVRIGVSAPKEVAVHRELLFITQAHALALVFWRKAPLVLWSRSEPRWLAR